MLYRVCLTMGRIQTHWLFLKYLYKFLIQYIISKTVCFSVLLQFTLRGWDPVGTVYTTLLRYVNRTMVECMLPMVTNGDNFVHVYRVQVRMYSTGHVYFTLSERITSQMALMATMMYSAGHVYFTLSERTTSQMALMATMMYSTGHVYFKLSKISNSQAALITMGGQSKWCTVQAIYILHFPK